MNSGLTHSKVVLLGDSGVGKTSITNRFVSDNFQDEMDSTMGASYMSRMMHFGEKSIKFNIWDTAGQERYRAIAKMYYQDAHAAILVYDITSRESFEGLKTWLHELQEYGPPHLGEGYIVLAIAGNKEDLIDREEVDSEEARNWAASVQAIFRKTSAKTAAGVEALFRDIAGRLDSSLLESQEFTRGITLQKQTAPSRAPPDKCKC